MFRATDLTDLIAEAPELGISIFMPTHAFGSETQQDPLRFKNLLSQARSQLSDLRWAAADMDRELAPAQRLMEDHDFWQHQQQGLAVFLAGGEARTYTLPVSVTDTVVVDRGYHLTPLLPIVASPEMFYVATMTSQKVEVFRASRFEMSRVDYPGPVSVDDQGTGSDYQNPVQASPVARPHTGAVDISHAQVYGDSPTEWRKARLVDFARRVAAGVDDLVARNPAPVVLVANAELSGHVRQASRLAAEDLWVIDADPASMDEAHLRAAAYAVLEPHVTASRSRTWDRFQELQGRNDKRAVTNLADLARSAQHGHVDILFISEAASSGVSDGAAQMPPVDFASSARLLNDLVVGTLSQGGKVQVVPAAQFEGPSVTAILRF